MSNDDRTARATYDDDQLVKDGALALRVTSAQFGSWMREDRRLSLEMVAVELFQNCEHYSQRAMRIRAALIDLPDIEDEGEEE